MGGLPQAGGTTNLLSCISLSLVVQGNRDADRWQIRYERSLFIPSIVSLGNKSRAESEHRRSTVEGLRRGKA